MNRVSGHRLFWPTALILTGVYFLLRNLDVIHVDVFWPLVMIALGLWLILRRAGL